MLVNKVQYAFLKQNTIPVVPSYNVQHLADMNKWITPRCSVRFKGQEFDVYRGFYDFLTWILQVHLDALFLLGSGLLTLQVSWRKIFPVSQQRIKNGVIHLHDSVLRSFTVKELRHYDGVQQRKIYFAVNGRVFDATSTKGIQFLDGPFSCLAGRDASRALATYSLNEHLNNESEIDDLSDLNPLQMDSLFHWEMQYSEMYPCVGRLVHSHQPRALQQVCISTIRTSMGKLNSRQKEKVDELPLPKILRNKIVSCE